MNVGGKDIFFKESLNEALSHRNLKIMESSAFESDRKYKQKDIHSSIDLEERQLNNITLSTSGGEKVLIDDSSPISNLKNYSQVKADIYPSNLIFRPKSFSAESSLKKLSVHSHSETFVFKTKTCACAASDVEASSPASSLRKQILKQKDLESIDCDRVFMNFFVLHQSLIVSQDIPGVRRLSPLQITERFRSSKLFPIHEAQLGSFVVPWPRASSSFRINKTIRELRENFLERDVVCREFFNLSFESDLQTGQLVSSYLLDDSNWGRNIYYFCLKFPTLVADVDGVVGKEELHVDRSLSCYVFQTLYPLPAFFFPLLNEIERAVLAAQNELLTVDTVSKFSTAEMRNREWKVIEEVLKFLGRMSIDNSTASLQLNCGLFELHYNLPSPREFALAETQGIVSAILRRFRFEEFLFLLSALLAEKSVVWVSRSLHLISSAVSVLSCALQPFKWPFPVVHSLPAELLDCLASPLPGMYGVQLSLSEFIERVWSRFKTEKSNVWVLLDYALILADSELPATVFTGGSPLLMHIREIYHKNFNSTISNDVRLSRKTVKEQTTTSFSFYFSSEAKLQRAMSSNALEVPLGLTFPLPLERDATKLFLGLRVWLGELVLARLPGNLLAARTLQHATAAELMVLNGSDWEFLRHFFSTQVFSFFVERVFYARRSAARGARG